MRLAAVLLLVGLLATVGVAQGTIVGSGHDFSSESWNTHKPGEVCGVCHIPHATDRDSSQTGSLVLWGRSLSTATYTMYFSYGLDGTQDPQPSGSTRLCLGCHDGSVALEHFDGQTTGGTEFIEPGQKVPGKANFDFGADHPISITYADGAGGDPFLRPRATAFGGTGKTIEDVLEGGKVQCVSCHDPHNVEVPAGVDDFLRIKNNDPLNPSALCLACHIK